MIVDPDNYDKHEAFIAAIDLCTSFLRTNEISIPSFIDSSNLDVRRSGALRTDRGFYQFFDDVGHCNVNVRRSLKPVKVPGFQWSYTGFKSDMTAPGVCAHETGHHVHTMFGYDYGRRHAEALVEMMDLDDEPRQTSYEPNPFETFAEATRLFILNPDLLRLGRPRRFKMLNETLGLVPVIDVPWKDVLVKAHPKLIAAAESWIEKGNC